MECYQKALVILEKSFGEDNLKLTNLYDSMGAVYKEQENYDKALEYYHKALSIKEKALNHENVKKFTEGKTIIKEIVIPGRIVNIVIK